MYELSSYFEKLVVMDNLIFDKQYLMHTPVSFLLKNKSMEQIENLHDDNGWNILHHAVATMNTAKISELEHFNINVSIISNKNYIPEDIYAINDKRKANEKVETFSKIPFTKSGFTAIHLSMFLFNFYQDLSQNGSDFFYNSICEKYQNIIKKLINHKTIEQNPVDGDGKTLFDYAFLMENIYLIDTLHMVDPDFSTLKQVDLNIANKIIEVMEVKYKDGSHEHIKRQLETKILHSKLTSSLPKKQDLNLSEKVKKV